MKRFKGKYPRTYCTSKDLRRINLVKLEKKGLLLTAAATLTSYDVGGWHKQRKVHDWNGSTKEMAKLSKSGEARKVAPFEGKGQCRPNHDRALSHTLLQRGSRDQNCNTFMYMRRCRCCSVLAEGSCHIPFRESEATIATAGMPSLEEELLRKVVRLPNGVQLSVQNLADVPFCNLSLISGYTIVLSFSSLFASQEKEVLGFVVQ
ncbi:hypothetical protein F2Q70_00005408 [Brassica cretica]|uniref:Uncharacterized protein n=1 Tax=Brassica cretica TaxID=69181 RepID=A0A8S9J2U9_BRACR|nr:hypothetical protein F2Q70_00005408 [Brassica cretica]